jgi:hypothetical protein
MAASPSRCLYGLAWMSGPCARCDDAAMIEYGHGVSEGAGQFSGSTGGDGGSAGGGDWGLTFGRMAGDAVDTVTALPAEQLLLLVVAIVVGFWILRRAL